MDAFSGSPADYMITGDDIERISDTETSPIALDQLAAHPYFGRTENCLKLISVLGILRKLDTLMKLVDALRDAPRLAEAANLELSLCFAMTDAGLAYLSGEGRDTSAARIVTPDAAFDARLTGAQESGILSVALKYMLFHGQKDRVLRILADLPADLRDCVLSHIVSINALINANVVRLQGPDASSRWIRFVETLHAVLLQLDRAAADQVLATKVGLLVRANQIDAAAKTVRSIAHKYRRLEYYVGMRKAIAARDFRKALFFSEKLIQISAGLPDDGLDLTRPFDRVVAEDALRDANRILRAAGIDVFIISGTLLGCIREGRVLEYDKDFDLGVFGWEAQFAVAQALMRAPDFHVSASQLRGNALYLMAARHIPSGYDFDIFFFHDRGDHYRHGIDSRLGYTFNFRFSKFTLSETEFLGEQFYIPSDYDRFLSENYGADWRTPDPDYFVKLESPALEKRHGLLFALTIRHEMLNLMGRRAPREKRLALVRCLGRVARKEDMPKRKTIDAFLG